jgi:hypothetical protein
LLPAARRIYLIFALPWPSCSITEKGNLSNMTQGGKDTGESNLASQMPPLSWILAWRQKNEDKNSAKSAKNCENIVQCKRRESWLGIVRRQKNEG